MAFHFVRPYWCLMIIPLVVLMGLLIRQGSARNAWARVCDPHLLAHLYVGVRSGALSLGWWILGLGWLLAVLAMAGPSWSRVRTPVYQVERGRVIVLDLSSSMTASDIKPSRLVRSIYKVTDILVRSQEGQVGMVVFSSEPFIVSPLTEDEETIRMLISDLSPSMMPVQDKPDMGSGIRLARELLQQAGVGAGDVIVLTAAVPDAGAVKEAELLYRLGFKLSVLGIGTPGGAPILGEYGGFVHNAKGAIQLSQLDKGALQSLARAGGGDYADITFNDRDIDRLLDKDKIGSVVKTEETAEVWQDQGRWLIFGILPLVLWGFRRQFLAEVWS